jgi:signal transduction histidine kinase
VEPPEVLSSKINILLVDDRPENISALQAILNDPSYYLITASSGEEALTYVLRYDFALILLDVFMAGMDGFEVAGLIKGRKRFRHIPIIFLTAMTKDIEHIFKAYSIGAVDYIQKPLEPEIVRAKVRVFVELYRNKQQIAHQERVIRQKEIKEKEYELLEVRRAGEKKFQDLVEGINHGFVWSADPDLLTFSYVSPRAELILGYPLEQWRTEVRFWANHLHGEDRERVLATFQQAQMGRDLGVEHRFLTIDGQIIWLHTGVRLARKGEGVGNELRGLSVDISHLKAIESALRDAIQVRDEFMSIASHELKTPLTPLKMQVQQFERLLTKGDERPLERERLQKFIHLWKRQLERLSRLVEELLDVSRINTGQLKIHKEMVNLSHLLQEIVERHSEEAEQARCKLDLSIDSNIHVSVDRIRIEQVIVNLLINAFKYASGKPVHIALCESDKKVILKIKDLGDGIPADKQNRIFERYERAVESAGISGMGLGLYISKQIVIAHEGSIRVESELGKGATFIVEMPSQKEAKEETAA